MNNIKKTSFDFPEDVHQKLKVFCTINKIKMIDLIIRLINEEIAKNGSDTT